MSVYILMDKKYDNPLKRLVVGGPLSRMLRFGHGLTNLHLHGSSDEGVYLFASNCCLPQPPHIGVDLSLTDVGGASIDGIVVDMRDLESSVVIDGNTFFISHKSRLPRQWRNISEYDKIRLSEIGASDSDYTIIDEIPRRHPVSMVPFFASGIQFESEQNGASEYIVQSLDANYAISPNNHALRRLHIPSNALSQLAYLHTRFFTRQCALGIKNGSDVYHYFIHFDPNLDGGEVCELSSRQIGQEK